jgi:hypothetical protein
LLLQICVDSQGALDVLHRLFEAVAPSVFRPVDILLKTMFAPPTDLVSTEQHIIPLILIGICDVLGKVPIQGSMMQCPLIYQEL